MLDLMDHLEDRLTLDLLLVGGGRHVRDLQRRACWDPT